MNYSQLATKPSTEKTKLALQKKGYHVTVVPDRESAFAHVVSLIPSGASVMNGSSVTLEQIGFVEHLKNGKHGWKNLHADIVTEQNEEKKAKLRQEALHSEYYIGSVHALTEMGDYIVASNTSSQLPHIVYTSQNIVLVVSTKKIVPDLSSGLQRIEEYIVPLEDQHMQELYKVGTELNKIVIVKAESSMMSRQIHFVLVEELLGF